MTSNTTAQPENQSTATDFSGEGPRSTPIEGDLEAAEKRGIGIGMAIAAGIVMAGWGDDTHAREILTAAGFETLEDLKSGGVDPYDINLVLPALKEPGVEMVEVGGKIYRKFIRYPEEILDDTLRCIRCGQIDEDGIHDMAICEQVFS